MLVTIRISQPPIYEAAQLINGSDICQFFVGLLCGQYHVFRAGSESEGDGDGAGYTLIAVAGSPHGQSLFKKANKLVKGFVL